MVYYRYRYFSYPSSSVSVSQGTSNKHISIQHHLITGFYLLFWIKQSLILKFHMLSIPSWINIISRMLVLTIWPHLNLWIDNDLRLKIP